MYQLLAPDVPLSQGDILDGCPLFGLEVAGDHVDLNAPAARWPARVIVLTQACDLAQTRTVKVLVGWVHLAQDLVQQGALKAQTIRDQVSGSADWSRHIANTWRNTWPSPTHALVCRNPTKRKIEFGEAAS